MKKDILLLGILMFTLPLSSSALEDQIFGDRKFFLLHDGEKREYKVHLPPQYTAKIAMPLVLAFHGGSGNIATAADYFGLNGKADKEGFIVVYPQGTGRKLAGKQLGSWNSGKCCPPASKKNVDDVGFIRKLITRLSRDFAIDQNRIYATGMSNGAMMSYRLACEMSDVIAAIAPVGAHDGIEHCEPSRPVPVIHFHGTDDPCAVYDGKDDCGGCSMAIMQGLVGVEQKRKSLWECGSVPDYIGEWAKINGCSSESRITYQNGAASCSTFQNCKENAEVTLCTIEGMGHTWPGQIDYGIPACTRNPDGKICRIWSSAVGPLNDDINANEMMWEFFQKHPKN
jgi:polyhydroxybutyrate depolymerase